MQRNPCRYEDSEEKPRARKSGSLDWLSFWERFYSAMLMKSEYPYSMSYGFYHLHEREAYRYQFWLFTHREDS